MGAARKMRTPAMSLVLLLCLWTGGANEGHADERLHGHDVVVPSTATRCSAYNDAVEHGGYWYVRISGLRLVGVPRHLLCR